MPSATPYFSFTSWVLDPPQNFLPTHLVLRVAPRPFSLAPVGFIHDNGTNFMSQYLMPLASSLPGTEPGPLVHLGGIPHGQGSVPSTGCPLHASSIYCLWGTWCVPVGSALCTTFPQDTISMGPRCLEPEEDNSRSHRRHGRGCMHNKIVG